MQVTITRRMTFSAGHRIFNENWDDARNFEIFGPCSNPHGHGHNYALEISVTGPVDSETGMVINLKDMKSIIQKEIIDKVDHKSLNADVPFMKGINPTTENLAHKIWEILSKKLPGMSRLVLHESENNKVEINR